MKPKQYLVFGFKIVARLDGKGGFDDLLESVDTLSEAMWLADEFLDTYQHDVNAPRAQIVNLANGLKLDINLATREVDVAHAREMFKTTEMDRPDPWPLH